MSTFDKVAPRFKSGNSVPVDRAYLPREEFEAMLAEAQRLREERDMLMTAIANAAFKAGISNGEVPLNGPECLMLLDEMAEEAAKYADLCS